MPPPKVDKTEVETVGLIFDLIIQMCKTVQIVT
jgi:hypothetical protein